MASISGDDHEMDYSGSSSGISSKSPPTFDKRYKIETSSIEKENKIGGGVGMVVQRQPSAGVGGRTSEEDHGCGVYGIKQFETHQNVVSGQIYSLPSSNLVHQTAVHLQQQKSCDITRQYSTSPVCDTGINERDVVDFSLAERHFPGSISGVVGSLDRSVGSDIRVERGYQSAGSSTTGVSFGSFGQSSNAGLVSPQDTCSGSGHGSGEGGSTRSDEPRFDHLDPSAALVNNRSRRRIDPMVRNDSMSSDQSESVKPRPPRPHKSKNRDRKPRQHSISSSDDEIQSTPDCTTSGEEHESESISEKGKYVIIYLFSSKE